MSREAMTKGTPLGSYVGESDGLTFWLAQDKDYDEVMAISDDIYSGNDYLPHRYHEWMTEPDRVVVLARREGKLVALESGLVVDGGGTVVLEGLRVCPSERGCGVAGVIQRVADHYIQQLYPTVMVKHLTRGDNPGPEKLTKFKELGRRAILSFVGEAESFDAFISHLKNKLHSGTGTGASIPKINPLEDRAQLKAVLLDPDLPSRAHLPGGAIIQDWQPLLPIEANLVILARRNLTWLADNPEKPTFLSFHSPPYPIPYEGGSLRLNIDMFGMDLVLAQKAVVGHLESARVKGELRGTVMVHVFHDRSLWEGLKDFCEGDAGVKKWRDYWEQVFLEKGM